MDGQAENRVVDYRSGEMDSGQVSPYPDYVQTITVTDSHGVSKQLVFPKALDLDRPKRVRTTFSTEQLSRLEQEFHRNQYLVGRERTDLAKILGLSETQVKVWFQNRRTKCKKDKARVEETNESTAEDWAKCNLYSLFRPAAIPMRIPAYAGYSPYSTCNYAQPFYYSAIGNT